MPADVDDHAPARSRLQPAKREAIVRGARAIFGRDGYSRASIDAIAGEAGVSTRTLYKHFESKERLFSEVLRASAGEVAEAFLARVEAGFADSASVEGRLEALGRALTAHRLDFPEHFAMVRQINAEAGHVPPAVLEAWQEAGPRRVEREVARRLCELAAEGALRIDDDRTAALHFIAVTQAEIATRAYGAVELDARRADAMVAAGVRAFLRGYAAD